MKSVPKTWVLHLTALIVVACFSSLTRPIWLDEFLQFAFAALPFATAVEAILVTTGDSVNHGQTGFYSFVNLVLLKTFGSSLFTLRFPSYLATYLLLVSAWKFIENMGFGLVWKLLAILALGANAAGMVGLMYFGGEARPYMLLASTTMATLAFYTSPTGSRNKTGWRLLGGYGIIIGFLNHPYFLGYWVACFTFGLVQSWASKETVFSMRTAWKFTAPWILFPGLTLYVLLGSVGWMRGSPDFGMDPWYWNSPTDVLFLIYRSHVAAWATDISPFVTVLIPLAVIASAVLTALVRSGPERQRILLIFLLIGIGLSTTIALSGLSYIREYWILPRQWVAGMGLSTIGMVWLMAELFRIWDPMKKSAARFLATGLIALTVASLSVAVSREWTSLTQYESYWQDIAADPSTIQESIERDGWERAANLNLYRGGPVDPQFSRYYEPFLK